NNGEPYMLDVGNGIIRYYENYETEPKIYSGSEQLAKFISSIDFEPDNFLYDTANDSAEDFVNEVWTFDKKDITIDERSADDEEKSIPNFTGMQADLVKQQLSELGLEYQVKKEENNEVHPNYVIRTEPRGGTRLRQGDTVTLYVSLGADAEGVITVDDYVGKAADDAAIMAGYKGFKVYTYEIPSREPQGAVVEQYPEQGTKVMSGSNVIFYVSAGKYIPGEITYKVIIPEDINGRYCIDIIWTNSDGKTKVESVGVFNEPEVPVALGNFTGEGSGLKATAIITNLSNDKKAELGHYIFDFDNGTYTIEDEDIEGAFEAIQ
ncbi:MAG: PASTA domain-containing protein, partial [Ruminococcus sp.]|nr:PASTA domain-containing protein [Ruminococcus sp.]